MTNKKQHINKTVIARIDSDLEISPMPKRTPKLRFKEFEGEWEETTLGELFTFKNGLNSDKEKYGSGIKFINVLDIIGEDVITNDSIIGKVEVTDKEFEKNEVIYGDVLFQRSSETREEVGQANIYVDENESAVFGGFVIRGRKKVEYNPYFINYLLKTSPARNEITTKSGGSTRYNVGQESLSQVFIKLTIIPEQQKIASFLTSVDKKIQQLTKRKALLQQYKKGVLQQLFSGELRFKTDDGKEFPKWEEKKLGDFVKINQGLQIAISERYLEPIKDGHFYITNEFLKASSEKRYFIKNPPKSVLCTENDILMTRTGNTGQVVTGVKGAFHNNFFKIKFDSSCNKEFLYYFLVLNKTQNTILRLAGTSTIPDLNHGDFYKINIHLPHIQEQQKIANYLSALDTKIESVNNQISQTQSFKKGLLQQLFV